MKKLRKTKQFCRDYGLDIPIIMAPMAGVCPSSLAAAVSNAGGMGSCGALLMTPEQISRWTEDFKAESNGAFLMNNWIPEPSPARDRQHEDALRAFLSKFGREVSEGAADAQQISFDEQCEAMLDSRPSVISSIMGLYTPEFVSQMKNLGIRWFATVTSVSEAIAAEQAGADALVVQGVEAGGHRGNFLTDFEQSAGLMALLPVIDDAVQTPLIATGGIADSRGISAAIMLGASAVQIGTGLLRTPEASIASAWADSLHDTRPEDTIITASFSGKLGRAVKNRYINAAHDENNPAPAPYPVQRSLTQAMRSQATLSNDIDTMQAWAGQAASLAEQRAARDLLSNLWAGVEKIFN